MTLLTYEEIAEHLNIPLCPKHCWMETLQRHAAGFTTVASVHWMPREVKRRGIYNFLKLAARNRLGTTDMVAAQAIWLENSWAYENGILIGIRFPREFAATDRARVRAELAGGSMADDPLKGTIERWARD